MSVVFISAELEEVLRLSDRLVVMRDRRKIDERPNDGRQRQRRPRDHRGRGPHRARRRLPHRALRPHPTLGRSAAGLLATSCCGRCSPWSCCWSSTSSPTPSFFDIRIQDGHLYGNLVDIVRNSAPVLLVALGMTLVIATRGIDLSVGAIAAIAAAVACTRIVGRRRRGRAGHRDRWPCTYAPRRLRRCSALWNGFLVSVLGIQPIIATLVLMVAGRGSGHG